MSLIQTQAQKKTQVTEESLLLRVPEAARLLSIQESTLRAWLLARRVSIVRLGPRCVRIPASEVQRLITEGTIPARARRQEAHAQKSFGRSWSLRPANQKGTCDDAK
jgi:excisionase family DNA binding protein